MMTTKMETMVEAVVGVATMMVTTTMVAVVGAAVGAVVAVTIGLMTTTKGKNDEKAATNLVDLAHERRRRMRVRGGE